MSNTKTFARLVLYAVLLIALRGGVSSAYAQVSALEFGTPVSGQLDASQAETWQFEIERDAVIEVVVTSKTDGFAPQIVLTNDADDLQAQFVANQTTTSFVYRIPTFGNYRVTVSAGEVGGRYDLQVNVLEAGLRDFEQGRLFFGQAVSQRISDATPYHLWTFEGLLGQVVDIRMGTAEGNLAPTFSLISPGGDVVATSRNQDGLATLLAYRLQGNGIYTVSARRQGENLGFDGNTSGSYSLVVLRRNGVDATPQTLTVNTTTRGRLIETSPLTRYRIPASGVFALQLELSNPICLMEVGLVNEIGETLDLFTAQSPLTHAIQVPPSQSAILEISSPGCNENLDYDLTLQDLNTDIPIPYLAESKTIFQMGSQVPNQWFFEGRPGELIELSLQKDQPNTASDIQIFAPNRREVYQHTFFDTFTETLYLQQSGIYRVQVTSNTANFQIHKRLIGLNGQLFAHTTPQWEQNLDVTTAGLWQFRAELNANNVLVIEAPDRSLLATVRATTFNGAWLPNVTLDTPGRYRLKVYGNQIPRRVVSTPVEGDVLPLDSTIKGSLQAPVNQHFWSIPVQTADQFTITVETLLGTQQPYVALLSQEGLTLTPTLISESANRLQLIGFTATDTQNLTLKISNPVNTRLDYRITTETLNGNTPPSADTLALETTFQSGFTNPESPTSNPVRLVPTVDDSLLARFDGAPRLRIPDQVLAEIPGGLTQSVWYLPIVRGQYVQIEATNLVGSAAPYLSLHQADGTVLLENWETDSNTATLLYRTPQAQDYYIVVTMPAGEERYLLSASTLPNIDEQTPNVRNATPIGTQTTHLADFFAPREVDEFVFWGNAGTVVHLTSSIESGNLTAQLGVFNSFGQQIANALYTPTTRTTTINQLEITTSGIYTVRATANDSPQPTYTRYTIDLAIIEGQNLDSGILNAGESVEGNLLNTQDSDVWLFFAQAGQSITLRVDPTSAFGLDPITLTLTDSDGTPFLRHSTTFVGSRVLLADVMLPKTGFYQAVISGGQSRFGAYRLQYDVVDHAQAQAVIAYGQTQNGLLLPDSRVNTWYFVGNQGDTISIATRPINGQLANLSFQLEAPNGNIIRTGTDSADGAGARQGQIVLPLSGIYRVFVGAIKPLEQGMTYSLSVALQNRIGSTTAGAVLDFGIPQASTIYASDIEDLWLFDAQAGEEIAIQVTGDGVLAPSLEVFPVIEPDAVVSRTGTLETPASLLQYRIPNSGVYAVRVAGQNNTTGYYQIRTDLLTSQLVFVQNLDRNTTAETSLEPDTIHQWLFEGNVGDQINLSIAIPRRSGLIPQLVLRDQGGNILLAASEFDGEQLAIEPYRLPTDGTFTIEVRPSLINQDTRGGTYTLRFTQNRVDSVPVISMPIVYNEPETGSFVDGDTPDRWILAGAAGDIVRIRVDSSLDTTLEIRAEDDPTFTQIIDDTNNQINPEVTLVLPDDGRYVLTVAPFRGYFGDEEISYRIFADLLYQPLTAAPQGEPFISYGETRHGVLETNQETITWYFAGKTGDVIDVSLQYLDPSQPLLLSLHDGNGNRYSQGLRDNNRVSINDFVLPADGVYQLIITQTQIARLETYAPYLLQLSLQSASYQAALPSIQRLQPNQTQNGLLTALQPAQTWLYEGQAGEQIFLTVEALGIDDALTILIYSPDNLTLYNGQANRVVQTLPITGIYQIVVLHPHSPDQDWLYRIALQNSEAESASGILALDETVQQTLNPNTLQDTWLITATAGTALYVRADATGGAIQIQLRDDTGRILATSITEAISQQQILESPPLPADGTYQLTVSGDNPNPIAYQLRATTQQVDAATLTATYLTSAEPYANTIDGATTHTYGFYADINVPVSMGVDRITGEGDLQLTLSNAEGTVLVDTVNTIENFLPPQSGYYLLTVTSADVISYRVTVYSRDPAQAVEPTLARLDVNLPGQLSTENPVENWQIDAIQGAPLNIVIQDFSDDVRHDMVLYDPNNMPVAYAIEVGAENTVSLNFLPLQSGAYTLRVGAWLNQVSPRRFGTQYALRISDADPAGYPYSNGGTIIVLGQPVRGGLDTPDTTDDWLLEGSAGERYSVTLQSSFGDAPLNLTLFNPAGAPIGETYVTQLGEVAVDNIVLPGDGTYRLQVGAENPEGLQVYSLLVSPTPIDLSEAVRQAESIEFGVIARTTLGANQTMQGWLFFGESFQRYQVTLNADEPLDMYLVDPDGEIVAASQHMQLLSPLIQDPGFYTVVVHGTPNTPYALTVQLAEPTTTQYALPLNTLGQAAFTSAIDTHLWRLEIATTGTYQISVAPTTPAWDVSLVLLDRSGAIVAQAQSTPQPTIFVVNLSAEDVYTLMITNQGTTLPAYSVNLSLPRNTTSPATIASGFPVTGELSANDPVDEWLFTYDPAAPLLDMALERVAGTANLEVVIFAPGIPLQQIPLSEDGTLSADNIVLPVEGTYIIQVVRNESLQSDATATYELTVNARNP